MCGVLRNQFLQQNDLMMISDYLTCCYATPGSLTHPHTISFEPSSLPQTIGSLATSNTVADYHFM